MSVKCECEDPEYASKLYDKLTPEERVKVSTVIKALMGDPVDAELIAKLDKEISDTRKLLDSPIPKNGRYLELLKRMEQLNDLKRDIDSLTPMLLKKLMDLDPHTYASNKRMLASRGRQTVSTSIQEPRGLQGFLRRR